MSVPVVGHDDEGQVVYLGECRVHGWHGTRVCPHCLEKVTRPRSAPRPEPPLNAKYRPGDEIIAFEVNGRVVRLPRRRFWTDSAKLDREGHCRMCRRPNAIRKLTRHHLIPQDWWRQRGERIAALRNAAANIVPLCRQCHDEVEASAGSRRMLRRLLVQTEIAFAIDVIGRDWLDDQYPA